MSPQPQTVEGPLELLLFSHDVEYAAAAVAAGMDGIVVDWESRGKENRQAGRDTEINHAGAAELASMRAIRSAYLICRVNNCDEFRSREIERAVELGANEIWLPMVRRIEEVSICLDQLAGRARLGVLVETREALALGPALGRLPIARVYMGLNDLHIDMDTRTIFDALVDGTAERFRDSFGGHFGVAGFTRPTRGHPLPCALLLAEMSRLSCGFAVARRSFRADVPADAIASALDEVRNCHRHLQKRGTTARTHDHASLCNRVLSHAGDLGPGAMR